MAALATGKKTAELTAEDLPAIKDVLLQWKANARLVGEVTASQTALATGEADILVGGGEWVTAVLAAENPALDFSIPEEGGILWSQSLGMFADSENQDLALKFIQYVMSPEGQARLATSSCYWGMPANTKAALTDEQKAVLRFDEQPEFLTRAQFYPAPDEALDKQMQDLWTDMLQAQWRMRRAGRCRGRAAMAAGRAAERWTPWGYVGPALAWTMVFFVTPFLVMAWVSLGVHGTGEGPSLSNYAQFAINESYWRALVASLEVTLVVTLSRSSSPIRSPGSSPRSCRSAGSGSP